MSLSCSPSLPVNSWKRSYRQGSSQPSVTRGVSTQGGSTSRNTRRSLSRRKSGSPLRTLAMYVSQLLPCSTVRDRCSGHLGPVPATLLQSAICFRFRVPECVAPTASVPIETHNLSPFQFSWPCQRALLVAVSPVSPVDSPSTHGPQAI